METPLPLGGTTTKKRRRTEIALVADESQRQVTWSKRSRTLFRKANDIHVLSADRAAVIAFTIGGRPSADGYPSLESILCDYLSQFADGLHTLGEEISRWPDLESLQAKDDECTRLDHVVHETLQTLKRPGDADSAMADELNSAMADELDSAMADELDSAIADELCSPIDSAIADEFCSQIDSAIADEFCSSPIDSVAFGYFCSQIDSVISDDFCSPIDSVISDDFCSQKDFMISDNFTDDGFCSQIDPVVFDDFCSDADYHVWKDILHDNLIC